MTAALTPHSISAEITKTYFFLLILENICENKNTTHCIVCVQYTNLHLAPGGPGLVD